MAISLADALRQTGYSQDGELAVPASVEPTMTSILQKHIASLPQQLATNQATLDNAIGSWNKTDFATGQPNANYRPEAINELTQLMPNVGALTAWHGTPHKIVGNFDINKVGTGEGAQAYGHGMYFAENPNVATQYRNILSKPEFTKNAEGVELRGQLPRMLEESYSELAAKNGLQQTNYGDVTDIVGQRLDRQMKDALKAKDMDWYNKTADMKLDLARFKESPPPNTGNLYKVNIPDEHIPNMLDWDKPLAQQNKQVLEGLKKLNDPYINKAISSQPKLSKNGEYWEYMGNTYGSKSEALEDATPHRIITGYTGLGETPADVSKTLNSVGIKGVRYLDQGSRIEGQGSRNFVVFEPSKVKILEENSKPVSRKDIIEKQVKALKE